MQLRADLLKGFSLLGHFDRVICENQDFHAVDLKRSRLPEFLQDVSFIRVVEVFCDYGTGRFAIRVEGSHAVCPFYV